MAEPVGTAIGVLGLAGLFSTTLQAWSFIDAGRAHAKNFSLFRTKLDNQRVLFMIWGKKMGFGSVEGYDKRLDDPLIARPIEQTLNHIRQLFLDANALVEEYGIEVLEKKTIKARSVATSSAIFKPNYDSFLRTVNGQQKHGDSRFNRFLNSLRRHQKQASIWRVTKWSIRDEKKFDAIVQHLADLVSDLDNITEKFFSPARSEDLAIQEVWKINDVSFLSEIEDATGGVKTILSRAASIRRQSIESSRPASRSSDILGQITKKRFSSSLKGTARAQRQGDDLVRPASNMTDASFKTACSQIHCQPADLADLDARMMCLDPISEEDDEDLSEPDADANLQRERRYIGDIMVERPSLVKDVITKSSIRRRFGRRILAICGLSRRLKPQG
ncbi:hypothetical protein DL771_003878 [Monosporascus sp. 5C6A]|nr:hypothetical protein DL771_003878 [Monosporascus sp. 5C6A]